jgi:anti-anti-sigma factor
MNQMHVTAECAMIARMRPDQDPPDLKITRSHEHGVELVALAGELDLSCVGAVEETLDEAVAGERVRLCLDLSTLEFIDSTGMATVFRAHQAVAQAGGAMVVVCAPGHVRRTFETAGFTRILGVADSRDAGLRSLASAG